MSEAFYENDFMTVITINKYDRHKNLISSCHKHREEGDSVFSSSFDYYNHRYKKGRIIQTTQLRDKDIISIRKYNDYGDLCEEYISSKGTPPVSIINDGDVVPTEWFINREYGYDDNENWILLVETYKYRIVGEPEMILFETIKTFRVIEYY